MLSDPTSQALTVPIHPRKKLPRLKLKKKKRKKKRIFITQTDTVDDYGFNGITNLQLPFLFGGC